MNYCTQCPTPAANNGEAVALLRWAEHLLQRTGVPSASNDARRLWEVAGGEPYWRLEPHTRVGSACRAHFRRLVRARCQRVPLAYLTGSVGFLDFDIVVRPGVFIPRPETEELAERAIRVLHEFPPQPCALDLGSGTGALASALARARGDASVLAVDLAARALRCTQLNVNRLGLSAQVAVRRSHWFASVPERFHLIVANPPYVSPDELRALQPEVRLHEPQRALLAEEGGLAPLKCILSQLPSHLHPGGRALIEIGYGHARAALALANSVPGLVETEVHYDMGGRARILAVQWM